MNDLKTIIDWCHENNVDYRSIASIYIGHGLPDIKKVKYLVKYCIKKNIKLSSISGMQCYC